MINVLISGSSGFIGNNLLNFLKKHLEINIYGLNVRSFSDGRLKKNYLWNEVKQINPIDVLIHLAGKAHDLKKCSHELDYFKVNTDLTINIFEIFLKSDCNTFIYLSSVKAVADETKDILTEDVIPNPITPYGKSKLAAEKYIFSKILPENKRVYVLRPCMIHGQGNKGNLNLLFKLVSKGFPWPLGSFDNKRSFCSIDNFLFIIKELIERKDIPSGIYNVADDTHLSTNDLISILAQSQKRKPKIWNIPKRLIQFVAKIGNILKLPLNEERLQKLTDSYVVSNHKIKSAIGKPLPVSSKEGLLKTFKSFN
jgi:nucleoside-diphosphate-sugar epimerase